MARLESAEVGRRICVSPDNHSSDIGSASPMPYRCDRWPGLPDSLRVCW